MTSRRILANRVNARASTGPKTTQGRARVAQNARRHGLAVSVLTDPERAADVEALAHSLLTSMIGRGESSDAGDGLLPPARRLAEAQLDLARIRQARHDLLLADAVATRLPALAVIDRYERRALSRRKSAIRELDAARRNEPPASNPLVQPTTPAK